MFNEMLNQGVAHHQAGRLADAERCYRQVLAADPRNPDALHLLGVIAYQVKQWPAAIDLISRAIALHPSPAMYHNNLGNALRGAGQREAASAAYERAIQLQPDYAEAHGNLGTTRRDQARFADALACYKNAIRLDPNLAQARGDMATVLKDQGRVEEAIEQYRRAVAQDPKLVEAHSHLLYALHASDQITPEQLYQEHLAWAKQHAAGLARTDHSNDWNPDRPLRIGFVSPDFRDHPVARFIRPIFQHRDRAQFQAIVYSSVNHPDEVTAALRAQVDEWHDVTPLDNAQLADVIRQHRIDILIDLSGHTGGSRMLLFARKPAPVQITYLGYPNTSGIAEMDYRITDALADPVGASDALHSEKLIRLDGCFLAYTLLDELPPVAPAPTGPITFGSFNNLAKISPTTLRLWSDVLAAGSDSRLVIKTTSLGDAPTMELTRDRFAALGLPMDRVELLGPARTQNSHLGQYARIDIALDTFPYNGTTTTCEALAMGVPVASLYGSHHASRVGLSILSAAGFGSWASDDPRGFVEIARGLTSEARSLRPHLRERLRSSRLCDGSALASSLERACRDAWKRCCAGSRRA